MKKKHNIKEKSLLDDKASGEKTAKKGLGAKGKGRITDVKGCTVET